jgi:hypothetical protein
MHKWPVHLVWMTARLQQDTFFVLASSFGLRGHKKAYLTILESADHALFKMVRYVLLRPLRPELDAKTKTCLAEGELSPVIQTR